MRMCGQRGACRSRSQSDDIHEPRTEESVRKQNPRMSATVLG